jgi:glycosyltransferase involved in cell wall biosynthesis/2-polyprenyl-3-methyl-5-hydroxy-6-metoxy-1,4-benzoquinol methylase
MTFPQMPQDRKYRIAIWTPLPPLKTGIADYVAELLPYLVENFDLEIFVDDSYRVAADLTNTYKVFSYREYGTRERDQPFDLNIYQMGNNQHHIFIYDQALKNPGLVVLHDLSLSFMLYHYYAGLRNDLALFKKEFLFSEGEAALARFSRLYDLGDNGAVMDFFSDHHMLRRLVGRNYAVLSHLEYCAKVAQTKYGATRAYSMYLGSPDPMLEMPGMSKQQARQQLDIPEDHFVMGVFGHLQPNKQNEVVLRALDKIKARHANTKIMFVGELNRALNYDQYIKDLIQKLNLGNHVRLTGFVPRSEMQKYYLASDVIVNLRYPSFGQMSATLSRGIATGRPAIITDLPEWRFFPESFCWRVPAEDTDGREIANLVLRLIEDSALLEQRSASAREFFLEAGTSQKAAENLTRIVGDVVQNNPGQVALAEQLLESPGRAEIIQTAFENWDRLRAGGELRYKFERVRKTPILGPILFALFVFATNLIYARKIRRAEWSLYKTLVDETIRQEMEAKEVKNIHRRIDGEVGRLDDELDELDGKAKLLEEEIISEFELEPIRIWDNPLGNIAGYRPRQQGQATNEDSAEVYYLALEQAFRGSEEAIGKRQLKVLAEIKSYVALEAKDRILDVGCGRGEFLSLLQSEGLHPIGIDSNRMLVRSLQEKGFETHAKDLFEYLSSIPDGTLKGITAFHVVEHLGHDQNMKFFSLAHQKLASGGFIYLETPNPLCTESLSRFYTDPTHKYPIQPFQLSFLLEYNYFRKVRLLFLEPMKTRGALSSERWITLYQDYGVLATKLQENIN